MENTNEFDPTVLPPQEPSAPVVPTEPEVPQAPVVPETPAPAPVQEAPAVSPSAPEKVDYRKTNIPHVVDKPIAGVALSDEALLIKEKLAKQPKMMISIPLDPGEKRGAYRSVTINGYRCEVKKGVMVNLPMSIAQLLMQSYEIESEALNDNPRNLAAADEETRRALGV